MSGQPFYDELLQLMGKASIEVRIEAFESSPSNAGGYCVVRGKKLIVLDEEKSEGERSQVLLEILEGFELHAYGLDPTMLSVPLRHKLKQRGNCRWMNLPTQRVQGIPKERKVPSFLRLVYDSSRDQEQT